MIPKSEIRELIGEKYLSIESISLDSNINELKVELSNHEVVAKWCGIDFNDPGECYLLNNTALIFAKENLVYPKDVVRIYGPLNYSADLDSEQDILGQKYLDLGVYERIINFVSNLYQLEIKPVFIDSTDQETFAVYTERGPYLLIEKNDDSTEVLNNLKTVIETEELGGAQFENLEYIDLRFGNKVYYKIK
jgi:hypothetical protein